MAKKSNGLLSGLVDLLKALDELAEGSAEVEGTGKLMGGEVKYRYSARYLFPYAEARPNIVPVEKDARQPLVDIFDRGDYISVIASIPNVKEGDLKFKTTGDIIRISADVAGTRIEKEVSIPKGSDANSVLGVSFKNGILEIKLRKKKVSNLESKGIKRAFGHIPKR